MRVACFGDVVGKSGRNALIEYIKSKKQACKIDCVIANGENSAHGFGIRQEMCTQLFEAGVDIITLGNHTFDQKDDLQLFDREKRLVRPLNYPKNTPGRGHSIHEIPAIGQNILIINVIGRVFMEINDDPFTALEDLLKIYRMGQNISSIIVDIHAESTAEKTAYARYFDGKVSAIFGTHTHVPTADVQILKGGTGFLSDLGMCGDYDSVIGMDDDASIKRLTQKIHMYARMIPATGSATVCGILLEIDNSTGLCKDIKTIRCGGFLREQQDIDV
ncbi:MAG: YmdB family metallophosphoesterase [Holosporales bacterium]|jgi:metallophosphoesterase (TIGR00282 family)|nr:YmdB family metallophosphoesterase [Holosporales bacterium]